MAHVTYLICLALLSISHASSFSSADLLQNRQIESIFQTIPARQEILAAILESRGTSIQDVKEKTSVTNDIPELVQILNSQLKTDVININNDTISINSENAWDIIRNTVRTLINKYVTQNGLLALIIENNVLKKINERANNITDIINEQRLSVKDAGELLNGLRTKSRQVRAAEDTSLIETINSVVVNLLKGQLNVILNNILESVKNRVLVYYVSTASENKITIIINRVRNTLVRTVVEIITTVQRNLVKTEVVVPIDAKKASTRIGEGDVVPVDGDEEKKGLLARIFQPIIAIIGSIFGPINASIKNLIAGILNGLESFLGQTIVKTLAKIIFASINLALPCNKNCPDPIVGIPNVLE